MKLIVNEKELREYFQGLRRLLLSRGPRDAEEHDHENEQAIRCSLRKELYAEEFAAFLQKNHGEPKRDSFRKVLLRYLHEEVELGTDGGSVAGVLREVGRDYAEIIESGGTRVLIRFAQINYVHAL